MAKKKGQFLRGKHLGTVESMIVLAVVVISCLGFLKLGQAWARFENWEDELHSKSVLNQCFAETYLSHRLQMKRLCADGECDTEVMKEIRSQKTRDLDECFVDYVNRHLD